MNAREIMELFNLDDRDVRMLSSMIVKKIPTGMNKVDSGRVCLVPLNMIVGYDRMYNVENWWDAMRTLHKMNTLKWISKKENFEKYMQNLEQLNIDGFPCVSEYNSNYYISDDGCHRLTVAKCIGIDKAYVYVKCLYKD